jgi:hypothetical protein
MRLSLIVGFLGFAAVGCYHGPTLQEYEAATRADGARADVSLMKGGKLVGELLAVDESALVIRDAQRLLRVPFSSVRQLDLRGLGKLTLDGRRPNEEFLRRAKLHSRFPSGMTPEIELALLDAYGQQSITEVTP